MLHRHRFSRREMFKLQRYLMIMNLKFSCSSCSTLHSFSVPLCETMIIHRKRPAFVSHCVCEHSGLFSIASSSNSANVFLASL